MPLAGGSRNPLERLKFARSACQANAGPCLEPRHARIAASSRCTPMMFMIRAGVRPIAPHHLAVLLGRHVISQLLAGRTAIDILGGVVDEVLLAETTIRLRA